MNVLLVNIGVQVILDMGIMHFMCHMENKFATISVQEITSYAPITLFGHMSPAPVTIMMVLFIHMDIDVQEM